MFWSQGSYLLVEILLLAWLDKEAHVYLGATILPCCQSPGLWVPTFLIMESKVTPCIQQFTEDPLVAWKSCCMDRGAPIKASAGNRKQYSECPWQPPSTEGFSVSRSSSQWQYILGMKWRLQYCLWKPWSVAARALHTFFLIFLSPLHVNPLNRWRIKRASRPGRDLKLCSSLTVP